MVPFDVTEQEWVRGKLLYRGVSTVMGVARRIALALPVVFLPYVLLIISRSPADDVLPHPLGAAAAILALSIAYVLLENFYRAPLQAARTYRENRDRWWPAELAWNADAIFLKNPQERLRYPLVECRAWKEDASLILLHSGDNRYWCLPKRALDAAGQLQDFERLLAERVPKMAPYKVVYR